MGQPISAAIRRSRLRILAGRMYQALRLPLLVRMASRVPWRSRSTITAWMVPLWRRGSMPMRRTRSLQVCGPCWIRMLRTMVRVRRWKFIGWCGELRSQYRCGSDPSTGSCATAQTVHCGGFMGLWCL